MTAHEMPGDRDIWAIVEMVWASYLDPMGEHPLESGPVSHGATDVAGSVSISGAWDGWVVLTFGPAGARRAAAALLGAHWDEVTSADITDSVGELVNIVGGGVKALMPQPTVLSLPMVCTGAFSAPGGHERYRLSGTWQNEAVSVCVLEGAHKFTEVSKRGARALGGTAR